LRDMVINRDIARSHVEQAESMRIDMEDKLLAMGKAVLDREESLAVKPKDFQQVVSTKLEMEAKLLVMEKALRDQKESLAAKAKDEEQAKSMNIDMEAKLLAMEKALREQEESLAAKVKDEQQVDLKQSSPRSFRELRLSSKERVAQAEADMVQIHSARETVTATCQRLEAEQQHIEERLDSAKLSKQASSTDAFLPSPRTDGRWEEAKQVRDDLAADLQDIKALLAATTDELRLSDALNEKGSRAVEDGLAEEAGPEPEGVPNDREVSRSRLQATGASASESLEEAKQVNSAMKEDLQQIKTTLEASQEDAPVTGDDTFFQSTTFRGVDDWPGPSPMHKVYASPVKQESGPDNPPRVSSSPGLREIARVKSSSETKPKPTFFGTANSRGDNRWEPVASKLFSRLDQPVTGFVDRSQILPIWPELSRHVPPENAERLTAHIQQNLSIIGRPDWMALLEGLNTIIGQRKLFRNLKNAGVALAEMQQRGSSQQMLPPVSSPVLPGSARLSAERSRGVAWEAHTSQWPSKSTQVAGATLKVAPHTASCPQLPLVRPGSRG